ncbi:FAD/NAD(P)-binding domain-containing protein [Mycena galericulata]|nr:FAD/NAD(P)-binding domain-containing protein [Mycena galericulata]
MPTSNTAEKLGLNVSIVGAGIAGLAAAIALRRAGHRVQIFDSAHDISEIGAAIVVPRNGARVLEHFGYDKQNLNGVNSEGQIIFDAISGEQRNSSTAKGTPTIMCHRSDLHSELKRLALGPGDGLPAVLHLSTKVVDCDTDAGLLELVDGRRIQSDLVLGADGIASTMRTCILGHEQKSFGTGWSCYRALLATSKFEGKPEMAWLHNGFSDVNKRGGPSLFMYPCRGGTLLNLAAPFEDPGQDDPAWRKDVTREEVQALFADFHPQFQPILEALEDKVMKWQMRAVPVLPTWIRGRAALIGDSAHATLPTLGQGAAMAVEEAAALGVLLPAGTTREDVPDRLRAYETLRKERGEFVRRESLEETQVPSKAGGLQRTEEMRTYLLDYDAVKSAQDYFQERFGSGAVET